MSERVESIWPSLMKLGPRSRNAAASRWPGRPGTPLRETSRASAASPGATSCSSPGNSASWRPSVRTITARRPRLRRVRITSDPPRRMDRGDAGAEIAVADPGESRRLDPAHKIFLVREAPDALDEIGIGVAVAGHGLPQPRQHREGIMVVEFLQPWQHDMAELQAEEPPARLQDAPRLDQGGIDAGDVAQPE